MRVFIDSDVVISSLLSANGAAFYLVHTSNIQPVISSTSRDELRIVVKRMNIPPDRLEELLNHRFEIIEMNEPLKNIQEAYQIFVTDVNDAHIVAGAVSAKSQYLLSYNLKHFKTEKIKDKLDILLLTPALFLQYLRSK